jgi:aspartyl-tRNA synthetase
MEKCGAKIKEKPFPVVNYQEAMDKYGADKFDLRSAEDKKNKVLAFAWVIDFPFFKRDKEGNWTYTHNPFSDPKTEEDKEKLRKGEIEGVITSQYDLVCNGYEVGGGSIRANDPELLTKVFEALGYGKEKIEAEFGHMLKAFKMGTPPHGGCAPGIDRLMMVLTGEVSMREIVAFPQTSGGRTAVMQAPSEVEEEQLEELGIKIIKK